MKKVLILLGGDSEEHDVSVKSAKAIITNIDQNLFSVKLGCISRDNIWYEYIDDLNFLDKNWLNKKLIKIDNIINYLKTFDVVFPITHGRNGEDGKLQGFLDLFGVKYVGSKTLASSVGMDKEFSKILFSHIGLKNVPYICINKNDNMKQLENSLSYPVIVKPANGGSSIGINKAENKKELKKAIKEASKYDEKILVEKFITARELEVAVLEDKNKLIISEIGEIIPCHNFYDYSAKYEQDSKTIICTDLNDDIKEEIKALAAKIFIKIGVKNYARIDFFLSENNIYINEINTIPGFTEISMYPKLIMNEGISYKDLITKLINNA